MTLPTYFSSVSYRSSNIYKLEHIYEQGDTDTRDTYNYGKNVQMKSPRSPPQTQTKLWIVCYVWY